MALLNSSATICIPASDNSSMPQVLKAEETSMRARRADSGSHGIVSV
ncbi:hypothetical protein [Streptomyces sp. NPDC046862]